MRFFLLLVLVSSAGAADLPRAWHGQWKGTLKVPDAAGKVSDVPMSLEIQPGKDAKRLTWKITYGEGAKASVRDYELLAGDKPHRFTIDEKNGILLDATLTGNVLQSHFEVGEALITARYELRDGALHVEITTCGKGTETGGEKNSPKVKVHPVRSVQTATLKK